MYSVIFVLNIIYRRIMKSITPAELHSLKETAKSMLLLDVREEWEHAVYNIGGVNIPLGDLLSRRGELSIEDECIVYCEKGIRSAIAIQRLEALGYNNLLNLEGGMSAWKKMTGH